MKVIIVGGVAGGASAAARIRRLNEDAEITIYEKSGYISYANCGLPYYIGEVITDKQELTLQTPNSFKQRFNVEVKVNHEVIDIDPDNKTVTVLDHTTNKTFTDNYDKLLLSPGSKPIMLNIKGNDSDKILTLRNVEDTFKIDNYIKDNKPKSVVVIGAGFIGLEMIENLKERNLDVSMVVNENQVLSFLDIEMASFVDNELRRNNINLYYNKNTKELKEDNNQISLIFDDDSSLTADFIIMAIGVIPENTLANKLNMELGVSGSIKVNKHLETSIKDIYAVGDATEKINLATNQASKITLAGPANKQARIVADNICGIASEYHGSQTTSILKVFDLTVASVGLNEKQAKALNLNYDKIIISPNDHASYYPDFSTMTIKVLFDLDTHLILGGQIVGKNGVDKRIDVLATAIYSKLKAEQLAELDLAYAPPYSSAKDPINMVGFVIDNILTNKVKQFYLEDLDELKNNKDITLLDVRTIKEYENGHVDGFINIPVDELRENIDILDKNKTTYVMCQSAIRSYIACRILTNLGFDTYNFAGGYRLYKAYTMQDEKIKNTLACGIEKD